MSFVAEPGWYHEAHEAFVPDRMVRGRRLFSFQNAEANRQRRSRLERILNVPSMGTPAALLDDLFEHSDGGVKEEKPWNG